MASAFDMDEFVGNLSLAEFEEAKLTENYQKYITMNVMVRSLAT